MELNDRFAIGPSEVLRSSRPVAERARRQDAQQVIGPCNGPSLAAQKE